MAGLAHGEARQRKTRGSSCKSKKVTLASPPTGNTVWPLVARVRPVWYVREREQKRLCFCSASRPPAESGEQRAEISPRFGEVECPGTSIPSPSLPVSPPRSRGAGQRWVWRCGVKQLHHSPPRPPVPRL